MFRRKKDKLNFIYQYEYTGAYRSVTKYRNFNISKILILFKTKDRDHYVSIHSKFNKIYYPVFDIDNQEHYDLFKKIYSASSYVIFQSSKYHYWAIVDNSYKDVNDILLETNWLICNDEKYIKFSNEVNKLLIRGIYENEERKPKLYEEHGNFSKNFQLFIKKIVIYYDKEGLELSVLKYKDPKLLLRFNRRRKLEKINENEK